MKHSHITSTIFSKATLGLSSLLLNIVTIIFQSAFILALVLMVIWPLVYWLTVPIPTEIQASIIVDQVSFRVKAATKFTQPIKFHSATFRNFEHIQFTPTVTKNKKIKTLKTVQITGKDERFLPTINFKTLTPDIMQFGVLHELTIAAGTKVALKIQEIEPAYEELSIVIEDDLGTPTTVPAPTIILRHRGPFQIMTRHCQINSLKKLTKKFEIEGLSRRNPAIKIIGQADTLRMMLSVLANQEFTIVPNELAVTGIDLFNDDTVMGQKVVTTPVIQGKIYYPAYPNIEPISFKESNFVFFGKADNFKINKISYDPATRGLKVQFSGIAEQPVMIYPQNLEKLRQRKRQDYRLTRSDTIAKASKFRQTMFDVLLWIIPIIICVVGIVTINLKKFLRANFVK